MCPRCKGMLLRDGRDLFCIACGYCSDDKMSDEMREALQAEADNPRHRQPQHGKIKL